MPRLHGLRVTVHGNNTATAADTVPYQWRRDGRTRDQALRAAGLGTAAVTGPQLPPSRRRRMTRADLDAAITALKALRDQVTP